MTDDIRSVVPAGWWDANVPADANPVEVVQLVGAKMPGHPMLPLLVQIAKGYRANRGQHEQALLRCPVCADTGWREIDQTGRGIVERCRGPLATGCPAVAHKLEQGQKRALGRAGPQAIGRSERKEL